MTIDSKGIFDPDMGAQNITRSWTKLFQPLDPVPTKYPDPDPKLCSRLLRKQLLLQDP